MRSIKTSELEPGFILARDVEDMAGYKLLKMGTALSNAQIALLVGWKIAEVWVEDARAPETPKDNLPHEKPSDDTYDPFLEAAREHLKSRFEGRLVNPWMQALYEQAEKRLGLWRSRRPRRESRGKEVL